MAMILRGVPAQTSDNLYGFDPYIHHYYSWYTTEYGTFASVDHFRDDLVDDRGNWPGLHILAGAAALTAGLDLTELYRFLPIVMGAMVVVMLFLVTERIYGIEAAMVASILFAVADYSVQMSTWLIPATVGLLIYTTLLVVLLNLRVEERPVRVLVVILFLASLVTHHFTHLILVLTVLIASVLSERRSERTRLLELMVPMILLTGGYWYWFGRQTGSFPDIAGQIASAATGPVGGISIVSMAVVAVGIWLRRKDVICRLRAMEGKARDLASRIDRNPSLLLATSLAVLLVTAVVIDLFARTIEDVDSGPSAQVTKYTLVTLGWVGLVTVVSRGSPRTRFLAGLLLMMALGYILVLLVFTFLPLELRFFEFFYIPLSIMSGVGVVRLARGLARPGKGAMRSARRRAVPVAITMAVVGMMVVAMAVNDHARLTSDTSKRYYHSDEEVAAAEWIAEHTEEDAVISAPFGVEPVVFDLGHRATDTSAISHSIIEKDIGGFAWDLVIIGHGRPHYILLTTDTRKYGNEEYLKLDLEEDIFAVGGGMLRTPELFEYRYNNTEILILEVSSNLTGVLWNNG